MSLMNEKQCKYKDCKRRLVPKLLKFIEQLKDCGFELFRKLGKTMEYWRGKQEGCLDLPEATALPKVSTEK